MGVGCAAGLRAVSDGAPGQRMPGGQGSAVDAWDRWHGRGLRKMGFRRDPEGPGALDDGAASNMEVAGDGGPRRAVATHLEENSVGKWGPGDGLCHEGELLMSTDVSMTNRVRQMFLF